MQISIAFPHLSRGIVPLVQNVEGALLKEVHGEGTPLRPTQEHVGTLRGRAPPADPKIYDMTPGVSLQRAMKIEEGEVCMGLPASFTGAPGLNDNERWKLNGKAIDVHVLTYLLLPFAELFGVGNRSS